mmetsp:Transcript_2339/g.5042  ORF Transcript_2339/g.5042 Transcript_2339/m.5042 type:complete len:171 (+) Transcript_2339:141-653(+)
MVASTTEEGCYLSYHPDSGGRLEIQYSRTPIPSAIGFWTPGEGKKIQGFKFTQNSGRQELIKGIAGGDSNKKKYFSGCCQFLKEAKKFKGMVTFHSPIEQGIEVDIFVFFNDGNKTQQLTFEGGDVMQDVSSAYAVACVAKGSDVYTGVRSMDVVTFMNKGNQSGCAITL